MLEKVRKPGRSKAIFAYVIFGAICLVFVFLGIAPTDSGFVAGGAAAVVNNEIISHREYRDRVRIAQERLRGQLDQLPNQQREQINKRIRNQALQELVRTELLAQSVAKIGLMTPDAEVRDYIMEIPAFNQDGHFQRMNYDQYLKNYQLTPGQFEDRIRKGLSSSRFFQTLSLALLPSKEAVTKLKDANGTKLNIRFVSFNQEVLKKSLKLKKKDIKEFLASDDGQSKVKDYFDRNKAKYKDKELKDVELEVAEIVLKDSVAETSLENIKKELGADASAAQTFIKKYGLKWEETGEFALNAQFVPKIGDARVVEEVVAHGKPRETLNRVLDFGGKHYIVELKEIIWAKPSAEEKFVTPQFLASQAAEDVFNQWISALEEKSKIQMNPALVAN